MNKTVLKTQSTTSTDIFIGQNITKDILNLFNKIKPTKIVYITDENLVNKLKIYLSLKNEDVLILQSGEKEKNLENLKKIVNFLLKKKVDKNSLIIGFGGGVISDITGFAASIFYRGIPVIFIPTTLLAQVDASIGGKNTINFDNIKNILGTFYQPNAIFIDIDNLKGLPNREFNSGIGEIIKYSLGFDKNMIDILNRNPLEANDLLELIVRSVDIKKEIVEKDPAESGQIRKLLNLGHTLGHALEAQKELELTHGEGVAIGLCFSAFVAQNLGNITQEEYEMIIKLINKYQLPAIVNFDLKKTIEKIKFDKKKKADSIDFITLKKIGEAYIYKLTLKELEQFLYKFNRHCEQMRSNPVNNEIATSESVR